MDNNRDWVKYLIGFIVQEWLTRSILSQVEFMHILLSMRRGIQVPMDLYALKVTRMKYKDIRMLVVKWWVYTVMDFIVWINQRIYIIHGMILGMGESTCYQVTTVFQVKCSLFCQNVILRWFVQKLTPYSVLGSVNVKRWSLEYQSFQRRNSW